MSARSIGRARGVVIECNRCGETVQSACVIKRHNREWFARNGWGRGACPSVRSLKERRHKKTGVVTQAERVGSMGTKTHDLCPKCMPLDRAHAAVIKAAKSAAIAAKAAKHKARDAAMKAGTP